ncbi:RecF/RecN/SMC [Lipomyces japonicus]|uniref:RecF/RecN/SMC n=1 Tax=Lipomyces japonicus TaxID=56871 RepID=UPI0034CEB383
MNKVEVPDNLLETPVLVRSAVGGYNSVSSQSGASSIQQKLRTLTLQSPLQANSIANTIDTVDFESSKAAFGEVSLSRQNVDVAALSPLAKPVIETKISVPTSGPEIPQQRLVITNLVLNNFKSYAGRQEIGPFHSSFSAVVGPNGSGKSNVIDSLLFVFGFRASKMRQSKLSALIHNSAQHPDLSSCSVEVHFQEVIDNDNGSSTTVPNSKLIVTRRAFKNNSSKYTINDHESSYSEVTTLLRDRGIDLDHKRFLILQGEVESIAQMKPKAQNENDDGLLEYLEDIIGTSKYKKPIEDSATEVETLNETCHEKNTRLEIVQKERDSLEAGRNAALNFLRDENELTLKKSALYQIYLSSCHQNISLMTEVLVDLNEKLNEEMKQKNGNEEILEKLQNEYKKSAKELEELQSQADQATKLFSRYEKDIVHLSEKKKHVASKQEKLTKLIASSKLSINSNAGWMSSYIEEIERFSNEVEQLKRSLEEEERLFEEIKTGLEGKTRGITDEIEKKKRQLEPWNEKINAKTSNLNVLQSELRIQLDRRAADEQRIIEQEEKLKLVKTNGRSKEAELENLQSELAHVVEQIGRGGSKVERASTQLEIMKVNVSNIRQKADEARQQFQANRSQNAVLSGLTRLNDSGRISGFCGRLGDLGIIDETYDVAISTAAPSLNNLVVESVDVGQACIEHLRKNNLGRAMFILLDKLPRRDLSSIQTPENAPRLFDLVKPKSEKFAQAFYSVLQDTLVAKDMAQANRIAYGKRRWRVVTVDGKLIDMSGTMSGGGTRVSRGLMRNKITDSISDHDIKRLEDEYATHESELESAQAKFNKMEDALRELQNSKPNLEVAISKTELEIQALGTHYQDCKKMLDELRTEFRAISADDGTTKALRSKIGDAEAEVQALKKKSSIIENEISNLEEKIMEIGGVKLRIQKSKVDGIQQQIEIRHEQVEKAEVAKTKAEKESAKQNKAVLSAEKELQQVDLEAEQIGQDLEKVKSEASQYEERANKFSFDVEEKQEQLQAMKDGLDTCLKDINAVKKAEIEIRNKIEGHEKEIKDNKSKLKHWSDKLQELSLHDLNEENESIDLVEYSQDELNEMDKNQLKGEIAILEERSDKAKVDLSIIKEYQKREKEFEQRNGDLKDAIAGRDAVKQRYEDLRRRRLDEFMVGFSTISTKLKEMYQMITMGGNAELELVDSLDPFSEGILFSVMPPKKSWKNISNLSGGEKTLSSLALVFALHHYKPTPLYVMDEIDAALDFRNVSIVANYIKERTKNAQFIVISLRNNMFELAKQLVGIYKVNHMTKSITIQNRQM